MNNPANISVVEEKRGKLFRNGVNNRRSVADAV
jgi:hypothetical protein